MHVKALDFMHEFIYLYYSCHIYSHKFISELRAIIIIIERFKLYTIENLFETDR